MGDICGCFCYSIYFVTFLAVFSAIKAAILTVPIFLIGTIGCVGSSIALLPYDFYKAYSIVFLSPRIGINVRIMLFFLLWIPLLLWVPLVFFCSLVASLFGGFFGTFLESYWLSIGNSDGCGKSCGNFGKTKGIEYAINAVQDFWNFNYRSYCSFVDEINSPNTTGYVFDINVIQIFIGLLMSTISICLNLPVAILVLLIKYVPAVVRGWYVLWKSFKSTDCFQGICFIPYVVATFLIPPVLAAAIPIGLIIDACYCIYPAIVMYKSPTFVSGLGNGFKQIFRCMYVLDSWTNSVIFEANDTSCFACFKFEIDFDESSRSQRYNDPVVVRTEPYRSPVTTSTYQYPVEQHIVTQPTVASTYGTTTIGQNEQNKDNRIPVLTIWDSFFAMCEIHGKEALTEGLCTKDSIESVDPTLIIGLPSLVFVRTITRSKDVDGIQMATGQIVNEQTRPIDMLSNKLYPMFMTLKSDFNALKLTDEELIFVERWLFSVGNEAQCRTLTVAIAQERLIEIKKVTSQIQSISTTVSRLPPFHRLFYAAVQKIIAPSV
ncbi:MAG: putative membrane protein [Terrestrivirus sp.]|uniref:Putative membrane protein n=1 Tax=Terrestrivirus sp. TaxID=2487775 RepID=A0A3G4ZN82_9VIRU|nr:MAG: putative membrane protein [Terrestrivirus sp.]